MDEINCSKVKVACKIFGIAILLILIWGFLAYSQHAVWPGRCTGTNLKIEKGDIVATTHLKGEQVAFTVSFPDQKVTKVIIYDYCRGLVIDSIEASR